MIRVLLLAGLLLGTFVFQAEARTLRYDFDMTGVRLDLGVLETAGPNSQTVQHGSQLYSDLVAAFHPLRDLIGTAAGQITLLADTTQRTLACAAGAICPWISPLLQPGFSILGADETGLTAIGLHEWGLYTPGTLPPGSGHFHFVEYGGPTSYTLDGITYNRAYGEPFASFAFTGLTVSDVTGQIPIAATPLPAAGWLYAALGLLLLRRRGRSRG